MQQLTCFGDERILAGCAYCGGSIETRDHTPPKALLDEPYPTNLPVVPSCGRCNHDASIDEEYVACLIECVLAGTTDTAGLESQRIARALARNPRLAARMTAARRQTLFGIEFAVEQDRVRAVMLKIARDIAAYELHEPQPEEPVSYACLPLMALSKEARRAFDDVPHGQGLAAWPEVGSRAMQRLAQGQLGWVEVQAGRFRYVATASSGVLVRMVLREYLACEILWA